MGQEELSVWAQEVDFSFQEYGNLKHPALLQVFRELDWDKKRQAFFDTDCEECPPGFGMTVGKRIFHLYTLDSDSWNLRLELPREGKLFGIFSKPFRVIEVHIPDLQLAEKLLLLFFDGKDRQLIEMCLSS